MNLDYKIPKKLTSYAQDSSNHKRDSFTELNSHKLGSLKESN